MSQIQPLGEKIEAIIDQMPATEVTILEILEIFGKNGLLLVAIFLSLIFLVPISIPGVSTVFGLTILFIGTTRLFSQNLQNLWLPKRFKTKKISSAQLQIGLRKALHWFKIIEKISKPQRLGFFATSRLLSSLNNLALIGAAVLLMMPLGLIPFSNTIPALSIILFCIGMMQKDGVSILWGHFCNVAAVAYFGLIFVGGGWSISQFFQS